MIYRNDCRLTCWYQSCDIPIHCRMPTCQINDDRQIASESWQHGGSTHCWDSQVSGNLMKRKTYISTMVRLPRGGVNTLLR